MAASAISWCRALGAVTWTTSMAGSATIGPPVGGGAAEAELGRGAFGQIEPRVGQGVQFQREGQVERLAGRGEPEGVGAAHEARADQADAEGGSCHEGASRLAKGRLRRGRPG
jgi:hypothetical protein